VGIHRINKCFIEEFASPGDLRFRIETDIRMPNTRSGRAFVRRLRAAVASSRDEALRDLLLERLEKPIRKKERASERDLIQVRRLVVGALSDPGKELPSEPGPRAGRRRASTS
jgi:hypothetical protein